MSGPSPGRLHLVLVPGFGGFDALGELEYYAGTTAILRDWCTETKLPGALPVLHYFDNFPTAGVKTRAELLHTFLTKLLARGVVQATSDQIVLIGHSTGGLDIRQLLCTLTNTGPEPPPEPVPVDGNAHSAVRPDDELLRRLITRVVFISVPQRGTNIANWVGKHGGARKLLSQVLRTAVDAADIPGVESADVWWSKHVTRPLLGNAERQMALRVALADVHLDLAERRSADPQRAAAGRAAHANVNLWLSHVHSDFLAITDLAFGASAPTPARFSAEQRERELSGYAASSGKWGEIDVRSIVTLGRCPFGLAWQKARAEQLPGGVANLFDVIKDASDPGIREGRSDLAYRVAYRICAQGPFGSAEPALATQFGTHEQVPLDAWQNDGIVNTASMLWPRGDNFLVHADHGDIIGHYALVEAPAGSGGRKYHTYDILESTSAHHDREFGAEQFGAVWRHIFEFAVLGP